MRPSFLSSVWCNCRVRSDLTHKRQLHPFPPELDYRQEQHDELDTRFLDQLKYIGIIIEHYTKNSPQTWVYLQTFLIALITESVYLYRSSSSQTNLPPDYCHCCGTVFACTWISVDYWLHEPIGNSVFQSRSREIRGRQLSRRN